MLLMGLRLREGISLERFARLARHGLDAAKIADLVAEGMLIAEDGRIRATPAGWLVLDAVVARLAA